MNNDKIEIQGFVLDFTQNEVETIRDFLQRLTLLWTPEVEELLTSLSNCILPLSGISAAKKYFDEIKTLSLPLNKKNLVFGALKEVSVNDLLCDLSSYLAKQEKETIVISETVTELEPESVQDESSKQIEAVPFASRMWESVPPKPSKYFPIDDEEYMVRSKYVHSSPTGIEEGYPPLVKKKKKAPVEY